MAWIDNIKSVYSVTTGDGKKYTSEWVSQGDSYSLDLNASTSNYINIAGTKVRKGSINSKERNLQILFKGDDCVSVSEKFLVSARDKRDWTVQHPLFGNFKTQCVSLSIDATSLGVVKISCNCIDVFGTENSVFENSSNSVFAKKEAADIASQENFANDFKVSKNEDISKIKSSNTSLFDSAKVFMKTNSDLAILKNNLNKANSLATSVLSGPAALMGQVQQLIDTPFKIIQNVKDQLNLMKTQFGLLKTSLGLSPNRNDKVRFENNTTALIGSASTGFLGKSFSRKKELDNVILELNNLVAEYLFLLQNISTGFDIEESDYMPNHNNINNVTSVVNDTVLFLQLGFLDGKKEFSVILKEDSNLILETHKYYGLDADGINVLKMKSDNDIGLNENMILRAGRSLIYYL